MSYRRPPSVDAVLDRPRLHNDIKADFNAGSNSVSNHACALSGSKYEDVALLFNGVSPSSCIESDHPVSDNS